MPINRSIFVDSWAGRIAGGKLHGAGRARPGAPDCDGAEGGGICGGGVGGQRILEEQCPGEKIE
jgi:hypothetical protein